MGDSWDDTSFEVSEADPNSLIKHVDSDDLDKELFGGLVPSKPSLLQAMKQSTGKNIFDDEDSKPASKPKPFPSPKPEVKRPVLQSTPKHAAKDDDLLADLLGDSDYSEISEPTPTPANIPAHTKAPQISTTAPARATPKKQTLLSKAKPKKDVLFDDDDDDLLGMLDSDRDTHKPATKPGTPARGNTAPSKGSDSGTPKSKFNELLSRTSLMKEEPARTVSTPARTVSTPARNVSTPVKSGPKTDELENPGFTPSPGGTGRTRRGLSSGVQTPKSNAALQPDDTFNLLMKEDNEDVFRTNERPKVSTPAKPSAVEDMLKVDRQTTPSSRHSTPTKPSAIEDMFRVDRQTTPSRSEVRDRSPTPINSENRPMNTMTDNRPHTHAGTTGDGEGFAQSRPPSGGRRANTAIPSRGVETPQRRRSDAEDSLFADEDIPNKTLPWESSPAVLPWDKPGTPAGQTAGAHRPDTQTPASPAPATPVSKTPLPWDNKGSATPQAAPGSATQIILQQNSTLEKKISELESEKGRLEQSLSDSNSKHTETTGSLNKELGELRGKVDDLEAKLRETEREMTLAGSRLKEATSDLDTIEQRTEWKYKDDIESLEKRHKDRIERLNAMLDEKEKMIQNEIKSASQRLKDKEAMLLDENKTVLQKWENRVEETEERYERKIRDITESHQSDIGTLKKKQEGELKEQQRLRKEELCAVLSVHQTTTALKELAHKVSLSAEEVANLTAKLDANRTVTLEERERAAKVMSEYLHDLKRTLDKQERSIADERSRLQDIVGKMESHLREQTRLSNAAQNKLITDEARFRSLQAAWEADKAEEERKLELAREQIEKSKLSLLSEHKEHMEQFYKERKEIVMEKSRVVSASQKATEQVAKGAVKQLDIEAQAQAMLDQAKREVGQIKVEKERWDNDKKTRQIFVESLQKQKGELNAEKSRLAKFAEKLSGRSKETEQYGEALTKARKECVVVQQQLAKLETELRMREDEIRIKEKMLKDTVNSLAAEKDLLKLDRQSLNAEGIQCPACQMYRPRTRHITDSPVRSSSPIPIRLVRSPPSGSGSHSPLSPLNLSLLSTGSFIGSRYKYPSPSVLELTGSLQRFNALSELDRHALQVQTDKLLRFKEIDRRILSTSFS